VKPACNKVGFVFYGRLEVCAFQVEGVISKLLMKEGDKQHIEEYCSGCLIHTISD
jgi:hypothetical protein